MGRHSGRANDNVEHPLPPEGQATHKAPEPPIVSDEQLAADVAQIDNAYGDTQRGS